MENVLQLKQNICNGFFGDTFNNVDLLLSQIVKAYNKGFIEKKSNYKDLITIYNALNSNDISVLKTLKKYEGQNFEGVLYDAYKDTMYSSFDMIKNDCYNFSTEDYDKDLSTEAGISVYNIKKLPKKMLINVSRMERNSVVKNTELEKNLDLYTDQRNRDIIQDFKSLSFVDNHDIKAYRDINQYVTFVYPTDIPNNMLITITRSDAWVKHKNKYVYSSTAPFLNKPQTLLDSTNEFNEIAVLRQDPHGEYQVKPIALLCAKKITDFEKQIAKKLDIPIIYSETNYTQKKYSNKKHYDYNSVKSNKNIKSFDEFVL